MKYGISMSTFATEQRPATFGDGDVAKHLKEIRALGYHGIDLFVRPMPKAELEALQKVFAENDMEVSVIFPIVLFERGMSLSDPDREKRLEAVQTYKEQIDLAARLDAKIVLGFGRGNPVEGEKETQFEERLAESMKDMADYAGEREVEIVMETLNRYLIKTFNRVDQGLAFLDRFGLDTIKFLIDTFQMNIEEKSIERAILLAEGRIGHVHAVDNNRGAPGDGHLDFERIVSALVETGYDEYLSVETEPMADPYDCARRGITRLREIIEVVQA
jgi:sugar phosphate isomerase/epimerase